MASESFIVFLKGFIVVIAYFLSAMLFMVAVRKQEALTSILSAGDKALALCPIAFGMGAIAVQIGPWWTIGLLSVLFSVGILLGKPSFPSSFETAKNRMKYNIFSYRSAVVVLFTTFVAVASSLPRAAGILFISFNGWLFIRSAVNILANLTMMGARPLRRVSDDLHMPPYYRIIFFRIYGTFDVFLLWVFCVFALIIYGDLFFGVLYVLVAFGASVIASVFFDE